MKSINKNKCKKCNKKLKGRIDKVYCSSACRNKAWILNHPRVLKINVDNE